MMRYDKPNLIGPQGKIRRLLARSQYHFYHNFSNL